MSVSWECKAGDNDSIYFIDNCCIEAVIDKNGVLDEGKSIQYNVGDKVFFLDSYYEIVGDDRYTIIKFRDENGKIFSAIETLFVTEDVWQGLKNYFKVYFYNFKEL